MDADELDALLGTMNRDELFASSDFALKNIRRKADARAFRPGIEFGLKIDRPDLIVGSVTQSSTAPVTQLSGTVTQSVHLLRGSRLVGPVLRRFRRVRRRVEDVRRRRSPVSVR